MQQTPDLDPTRSAEALAQDIDAYIGEAMRLLESGEIVALTELNGAVEVLCQRVLNAPADSAQGMIPRLESLRARLDTLQHGMKQAQDEIRAALDATTKRQKASKAYRPPEEKK